MDKRDLRFSNKSVFKFCTIRRYRRNFLQGVSPVRRLPFHVDTDFVMEMCCRPLELPHEQKRGVCIFCERGWVEEDTQGIVDVFATETERLRASDTFYLDYENSDESIQSKVYTRSNKKNKIPIV